MEARVDEELPVLRKPVEISGVERVDLLLRLLDVAPGFSLAMFCQLLLWRVSSDFCSAVNASGRQRRTSSL